MVQHRNELLSYGNKMIVLILQWKIYGENLIQNLWTSRIATIRLVAIAMATLSCTLVSSHILANKSIRAGGWSGLQNYTALTRVSLYNEYHDRQFSCYLINFFVNVMYLAMYLELPL